MRRASIKTCHAYEYMVDVSGRYANVGFTLKDMYNKLDASQREDMIGGDANATLGYLIGKAVEDKKLFYKYNTDENKMLANLFWRDLTSLADYSCFGDVLVFDSTFIVFETDYHHLDRSGMKCLYNQENLLHPRIHAKLYTKFGKLIQEKTITAVKNKDDLSEFASKARKKFKCVLQYTKGLKNAEKIFVPILDPDTTPNHWFFIVIKMGEMEVEIWDTCPRPSHTTPQDLDSVNRYIQLILWMLKHPNNQALVKAMEALDAGCKKGGAKKKIKTKATSSSNQNHDKSSSKATKAILGKPPVQAKGSGRGRPLGSKNKKH
ncbi:hypothetical protein ACLB2K_016806 [Fragaria x ananassa]